MVSITNYFKAWGDSGTEPTGDGTNPVNDYAGGDQVYAKHFDYLWDKLNKLFDDIIAIHETDGFSPDGSGVVNDGDGKVLYLTEIGDGDEFYVTQASLTNPDGTAVPTDCDLVIVSDSSDITSGTVRSTVLSGGSVHADSTGDPLDSYTNSSGGTEIVALVVDNGHYNAGSGSDVDHTVSARGRTQ